MHEQLFEVIDTLLGEFTNLLEDICNIESPTSYKAGVDKVGEYCICFAEARGWETQRFPEKISGDTVLITMNPDAEGSPITLSAHMDTVHPVGSFGTPAVRRDDEKMYGPGVMDCKGGIAAALLAMVALEKCGFKDRPIKLFLQSDEETSSATSDKNTVKNMCECAKGSVGFINLEGSVKNTAVLARKGIIRHRYTVWGKALHSARCAYAVSAIAEAAAKILELEKMKNVDGLTCNCGVISGGTAPNTVAEKCTFTTDIRFLTEEELLEARETVKRIAETSFIEGSRCDLEEMSFRPSMPYTEQNKSFLNRINEIYEKCGLPTLTSRLCVSGSDAAYITREGIPCVDNLGTEGGNIHSVNEFIKIPSIAESAKRIASVIYYI